ncbi:phospho-acceptor domain-containing protein [Limnobacter thiooxidans]|uniref:Virulence sensor protein BvgS n=1 Tax=Limnobacter thiooxidans TaxID=131080 RepID=A0AA86J332_9BURK|nr:phospho-acceptor domain-containing protein [Limnobacter thiooxidans]BET26199.1 hypothetical protein RGQ30_17000 [Limnobacter thiooxidans]
MKANSSKTPSVFLLVSNLFKETWQARPLLCLLLGFGVAGSMVFWTQLGELALFGQLLLVVLTAGLAAFLGSALTKAWIEFRLRERLHQLGEADLQEHYLANSNFFETLANAFHRLNQQKTLLSNGFEEEKRRLLSVESCLNGFVVEFTVTEHGRIQVENVDTSIERFFPMTRAEFIADWSNVLKHIDPKYHTAFKTVLARPEAFPNRESLVFSTLRRSGGEPQYYQLTVQREAKPAGVGLYAVCLDVSDLVLAKEQAESADRAKSEFLATISHELRTPLNAIIGFSKMLEEQLSDSEMRGDARNISSSATSLHLILSDVLEYSRIEANGLKLDASPFDLDDLVRQVHALNLNLATKKNLEFTVSSELSGPTVVLGDSNRVLQIVQNLVSNALKFTDSGYVRMKLFTSLPSQGRVEVFLEVADSGIGISQTAFQRLFQRFSQASREIHRQFGGTGLGLAICKGLVELMGGRIDVSSELGVGSVFTVSLNLPVAQPLVSAKAVKPIHQAAQALNVLVVDDHPMNIKLLDRYLGKRGHKVSSATGGRAAVDLAQAEYFDLILMDIDMPDMDGHAATRLIRSNSGCASRQSFVCALSGLSDDQSIAQSTASGMSLHLTKPVSFDRLDQLIDDLSRKVLKEKANSVH